MNTELLLIMTTLPENFDIRQFATTLLNHKYCVCIQAIPKIQSFYEWNNAIQNDQEQLIIIKCLANKKDALEHLLLNIHPYDIPEIITITPNSVTSEYLDWANSIQ